eukprot:4215703-Prorocentrum_lima.AAC.1
MFHLWPLCELLGVSKEALQAPQRTRMVVEQLVTVQDALQEHCKGALAPGRRLPKNVKAEGWR